MDNMITELLLGNEDELSELYILLDKYSLRYALVEHFEGKDFSVYLREVKYGLGEGDYMYEIHIL